MSFSSHKNLKPLPIKGNSKLKKELSQDSYVIVRIWPTKTNNEHTSVPAAVLFRGNVGHVSIEIVTKGKRVYASHWPGEDMVGGLNPTVKSHENRELKDDINGEFCIATNIVKKDDVKGMYHGANPDYCVKLLSLDTEAMLTEHAKIKNVDYCLKPTKGKSFNCVSLAHTLLVVGGFNELNPAEINSLTTPGEMIEIVKSACKKEASSHKTYDEIQKRLHADFLDKCKEFKNTAELYHFLDNHPDWDGLLAPSAKPYVDGKLIKDAAEIIKQCTVVKNLTKDICAVAKEHTLEGVALEFRVNKLLKKGANITLPNEDGFSAAYWAIHHDYDGFIKLCGKEKEECAEIALKDIAEAVEAARNKSDSQLPIMEVDVKGKEIKISFPKLQDTAENKQKSAHILTTLNKILSLHVDTKHLSSSISTEDDKTVLVVKGSSEVITDFLYKNNIPFFRVGEEQPRFNFRTTKTAGSSEASAVNLRFGFAQTEDNKPTPNVNNEPSKKTSLGNH